MGKKSARAIVLDAGALIAFEKADVRMRALLREALQRNATLLIPAGVVAQVFRDRARQVSLGTLLASSITEVPVLDRVLAEAVGTLCGRTRSSDVVDASVVLVARKARAAVVSSDPDDLHRLDPWLEVHRI